MVDFVNSQCLSQLYHTPMPDKAMACAKRTKHLATLQPCATVPAAVDNHQRALRGFGYRQVTIGKEPRIRVDQRSAYHRPTISHTLIRITPGKHFEFHLGDAGTHHIQFSRGARGNIENTAAS
jgi:hypothetical protein